MIKHVLIVEDQVTLAKNIVRYLQRKGIEANSVRTSIEALPYIIGQTLDWIVIDINLPDANGLDFCSSLHTQKVAANVILVSGYIDHVDSARAERLGISHLLVKPFSLSNLYSMISSND